jgi:hypothetical protein
VQVAARLWLPGSEIALPARPGTCLEVVLNRNRSAWQRADVLVGIRAGLIGLAIRRCGGQDAADSGDMDAA